MAIDSEVLITLVQARPVLWDKTLENYKDRNLTRNAWNEVCIELNSEFEELGDKEKMHLVSTAKFIHVMLQTKTILNFERKNCLPPKYTYKPYFL